MEDNKKKNTSFTLAVTVYLASLTIVTLTFFNEDYGIATIVRLLEYPAVLMDYIFQGLGATAIFPTLHVALASIYRSKRNPSTRRRIFIGWSLALIAIYSALWLLLPSEVNNSQFNTIPNVQHTPEIGTDSDSQAVTLLLDTEDVPVIESFIDKKNLSLNSVILLTVRIYDQRQGIALDLSQLDGRDFGVLGFQTSSHIRRNEGQVESWSDYIITLLPLREGLLEIPSLQIYDGSTQRHEVGVAGTEAVGDRLAQLDYELPTQTELDGLRLVFACGNLVRHINGESSSSEIHGFGVFKLAELEVTAEQGNQLILEAGAFSTFVKEHFDQDFLALNQAKNQLCSTAISIHSDLESKIAALRF